MRWLSLMTLSVCIAFVGCRSNNADRAYLYQELREQEDEIYALEDQLKQQEAKLASCHRANQSLRREGAGGQDDGNLSPSSIPQTFQPPKIDFVPPTTPDTDAPAYEPSKTPLPKTPTTLPLEAPGFDLPDAPDVKQSEGSENRQSSYNELSPRKAAPRDGASRPRFTQAEEEEITDYHVDHITLNRQLTGAHDRDGHPGDEGVYIVVEPRNAADQVIDVPGKLTIVVTDPSKRGPDARIARWDYTMEEAADSFRQSIFGRGMHLELPWPGDPPQGRELSLFVRFVTDNGRRLIVEKSIQADPLPPDDDVANSRDRAARRLTHGASSDTESNTTRVAEASQDNWQRRTRSFQSLVPAPRVQPQAPSVNILQESEPPIAIPTTGEDANFTPLVNEDIAPETSENAPQTARVLSTPPNGTEPNANGGPEQVRYEFAPKQKDTPKLEPQPRPKEEQPPATSGSSRRPKWSPYR